MSQCIVYVIPENWADGASLGSDLYHYAKTARAALQIIGGFEVEIIGFHPGLDRYVEPGLRLLPAAAALPLPGPELWDALGPADLVHVLHPAHPGGGAAMVIAQTLGKPIVASYCTGGELDFIRYGGGLALADAVLFPAKWLAMGLGAPLGPRAQILPIPIDDRLFAPPPPGTMRRGIVSADPINGSSRLDRLITALPAGLSLTLCGAMLDPEHLAWLHLVVIEPPGGRDVRILPDLVPAARAAQFAGAAIIACNIGGIAGYANSPHPGEAMASGGALLIDADYAQHDLADIDWSGRSFRDQNELEAVLAEAAAGAWPVAPAAGPARAGLAPTGMALTALYHRVLAGAGG